MRYGGVVYKKFGLPAAAAVGMLFGLFMVYYGLRKAPPPPILFEPPRSPYKHYIAGSGIIEANTQNISIGTALGNTVTDVYVIAGDIVEKGAPLFRLDLRELNAQLAEAQGALDIAKSNFEMLLASPRPENIPPVQAQANQARIEYENQYTRWSLYQSLSDPRAVSVDEMNQRYYSAKAAEFAMAQAEAQLDLLLAGTWIKDLEIASAQIEQAEGQVKVVLADIDRSTIRAPCKGQVLQVNIRIGEFAQGTTFLQGAQQPTPPMLFGSIEPLHIRVDVAESDIWRVIKGAQATAFVRGNSSLSVPLRFVRFEPYVVPKISLTGDTSERVDTRVLQIIYALEKKDLPIFAGEIMDVFIEAKPSFK